MEEVLEKIQVDRYPAYRDSGISWLGEVPENWVIDRLKNHIELLTGFPFQSQRYADSGIKLARGINVKEGYFDWSEVCHWTSVDAYLEAFVLKAGDILIGMDGSKVGKNFCMVCEEDLPILLLQRVARMRPTKSLDSRFLYYLIADKGFLLWVEMSKTDPMVPHIAPKDIYNFRISVPPIQEQTAIAAFLDRKTAQIDNAISIKERQIELLKERRQILIQSAVTRGLPAEAGAKSGLDPNVKMKDSGVEWIGKIPEKWEVKKLKYLGKIKYGLGQPPKEKEGGLPLIRATNVERGRIVEKDLIYVDPEDIPWERDPELKENDIIVVRSGAYTADSAIIPKKYEGSIAGYDMVITPKEINPTFLSYCLLAQYILYGQLYLLRLRAAQPHLNAEELGQTIVFCPPKEEQAVIVSFINIMSQKIFTAIKCKEMEIEKLKEYKATLINSAVTGKVRVRLEH
ncbi:MAG TPA: restriction endonuclease subunit S [Saprospiraceae bacterium]|nr:restriction endonuclease subunit S [Saprospiraceae bacterium]